MPRARAAAAATGLPDATPAPVRYRDALHRVQLLVEASHLAALGLSERHDSAAMSALLLVVIDGLSALADDMKGLK